MTDHALEFQADLSKCTPGEWAAQVESMAEDLGSFEPLGARHMAAFLDAGPKLLVTFENAPAIRKIQPNACPFGFQFAQVDGWSVLTIISVSESWFRDKAIYGYFDRLVDDGFFEDFDSVLFYGAHSCGYAAAAYSVAAPGSRVLALRPQATLDPRIAGFDTRYIEQRRTDFTSRYGYAPDMIDGTNHAYIAFDPLQRFDAIHAALFTRPNMTPLRAAHMGGKLDLVFDAMGMLDDMLRGAMYGSLTSLGFAKALRARRGQKGYVRSLYQKAIQTGHYGLAANVCALVLRQGDDPFFEDKLAELADQGHVPTTPIARNAAE